MYIYMIVHRRNPPGEDGTPPCGVEVVRGPSPPVDGWSGSI